MGRHPFIRIPGTEMEVLTHHIFLGLAISCAAWLSWRWIPSSEWSERRRILRGLFLVAISTIVGGHLHFVLANWSMYDGRPWSALLTRVGALHAPGAILGAVSGGTVALRMLQLSPARFIDGIAPAAGLGIAIARVGCVLSGCCFGDVCEWSWCAAAFRGTVIHRYHASVHLIDSAAQWSRPIHPLPLYFAAIGLLITAGLLWWRPRRRFDGELGILFLLLFAASSALLEPLRGHVGRSAYWGPLSHWQWMHGAVAGVAIMCLIAREYRTTCRHRLAGFATSYSAHAASSPVMKQPDIKRVRRAQIRRV